MWVYQGNLVEDIEAANVGFVYLITNLKTNKKYIGKKLFKNRKSKVVKGKRKKYLVDSDWRDYYGSNAELLTDVELLGAESFTREILHFCLSKTECNYEEARQQFLHDVLRYPDKWYNRWISVKVNSRQLSARFAPAYLKNAE